MGRDREWDAVAGNGRSVLASRRVNHPTTIDEARLVAREQDLPGHEVRRRNRAGLNWAGNVDVSVPYEWNPATMLPKVPETSILGIEAPNWSETLASMSDVEFMAFPRTAAVAEVA